MDAPLQPLSIESAAVRVGMLPGTSVGVPPTTAWEKPVPLLQPKVRPLL